MNPINFPLRPPYKHIEDDRLRNIRDHRDNFRTFPKFPEPFPEPDFRERFPDSFDSFSRPFPDSFMDRFSKEVQKPFPKLPDPFLDLIIEKEENNKNDPTDSQKEIIRQCIKELRILIINNIPIFSSTRKQEEQILKKIENCLGDNYTTPFFSGIIEPYTTHTPLSISSEEKIYKSDLKNPIVQDYINNVSKGLVKKDEKPIIIDYSKFLSNPTFNDTFEEKFNVLEKIDWKELCTEGSLINQDFVDKYRSYINLEHLCNHWKKLSLEFITNNYESFKFTVEQTSEIFDDFIPISCPSSSS